VYQQASFFQLGWHRPLYSMNYSEVPLHPSKKKRRIAMPLADKAKGAHPIPFETVTGSRSTA
jgi:hypothetical protein